MWLKDSTTRHFALQIAFFQISARLSGPQLYQFKIETFFMEKTGDPLIVATTVCKLSKKSSTQIYLIVSNESNEQ